MSSTPSFWWTRRWDIKRVSVGDVVTVSGACLKHGNPWPSRRTGPELPCIECAQMRYLCIAIARKVKPTANPARKLAALVDPDTLEVEAVQVPYLFDGGGTVGAFWCWRVAAVKVAS